jgi:hypothetical protein
MKVKLEEQKNECEVCELSMSSNTNKVCGLEGLNE